VASLVVAMTSCGAVPWGGVPSRETPVAAGYPQDRAAATMQVAVVVVAAVAVWTMPEAAAEGLVLLVPELLWLLAWALMVAVAATADTLLRGASCCWGHRSVARKGAAKKTFGELSSTCARMHDEREEAHCKKFDGVRTVFCVHVEA